MEKNFYKNIVLELKLYLSPLVELSADGFIALLENEGWYLRNTLNNIDELKNEINEYLKNVNSIYAQSNSFLSGEANLTSLLDFLKNLNFSKKLTNISYFYKTNESFKEQLPELLKSIFNHLTVRYLEGKSSNILPALAFLQIYSKGEAQKVFDSDNKLLRIKNYAPEIKVAKFFNLLSSPNIFLRNEYFPVGTFETLDGINASADKFFPYLGMLLSSIGIFSFYGEDVLNSFSELLNENDETRKNRSKGVFRFFAEVPLFEAKPDWVQVGAEMGFTEQRTELEFAEYTPGIFISPSGSVSLTKFTKKYYIEFGASLPETTILISKSKTKLINRDNELIKLVLRLTPYFLQNENINRVLLFGKANENRLDCKTVSFETSFIPKKEKFDIGITVFINDANLVFKPNEDDFLKSILKDGIDSKFNFSLGFSNLNGFHFSGSGTLDIPIPTHQTFGPVTLSEIVLAIGLAERGLAFKAGASIAAKLGPLNIGVKEMGLKFDVDFPENANGNLGLLNLAPGIKPPKGISLGLDSGGFRGGGFLHLDYEKGEYSGGFELNFQNQFNVKAIAVLNTKGVEGGGFSLFILLTAEFTPAFQLGFGFALQGVGGMLGLHRRIDQSAMREAVRSEALSHLLFPKGETADIVSQAPAIISAANTVFPAQNDNFVFGPMAKIIWGPDNAEILNVELGLIIQTNPVALAVIGLLRCTLPNKYAPLIDLRMVFAGGIDTSKKLIWFDAQLIESRIIGYTATGSMRLRIAYGDKPDFVLSVGGFHPSYNPPARLELGVVNRMAIRMFESDNVQLRAESYFALTSNTVQFGGAVWLKAKFWKLNVNGDLTYNVLFQFNPFHFYADVHLNLSIKVWKLHFYAGVYAVLEGPNPWKLTGNISIETPWPFPDIDVDFEVEWGDENKEIAPSVAVYPLLETALGSSHNWSSRLPDPALFQETLRPQESGTLVLHPFGQLRITQQVIPLNVKVSRLGTLDIIDAGNYSISSVTIGGSTMVHKSVQTAFAPAQFGDHSDAEKLALEGYQNMDSGVERNWAGNDYDFDFGVPCPEARALTYELGYDTCTSLKLKGNRDSACIEEKGTSPDTNNTSELKLEGTIQHLLNNNQMKESKLSGKARNASALSMKKTEFVGEKYGLINANGALEGKPVIFKLMEIDKDNMLKKYEGRFRFYGIERNFGQETLDIRNLMKYRGRFKELSFYSQTDRNNFLEDAPLMKDNGETPVIQLKLISNLLETGDSKDNAQENTRIPKYMLRTLGDKY